MSNEQFKIWLRYYRGLAGIAIINALGHIGYVVTGAGVASAARLVSPSDFSTKGILLTMVGTVAANIAGAIYRNPIPDPKPPVTPV